jgi:hypothetical protein
VTDDLEEALPVIDTLKKQFLDGAGKYPQMGHYLVEWKGGAISRDNPPVSLLPLGDKSTDDAKCNDRIQGPLEELTEERRRLLEGSLPEEWTRLNMPADEEWFFCFRVCHRKGKRQFEALARSAWSLLYELPITIPIPENLKSTIEKYHPKVVHPRPDWGDDAFSWLQLVHWLGVAKAHRMLKFSLATWCGDRVFLGTQDEFKALQHGSSLDDRIKLPFDRIISSSNDIFMNSYLALNWFKSQILANRPPKDAVHALRLPESAPTGNSESAPTRVSLARPARKRTKPGEAALRLDAALDSLIQGGEWGKTNGEICERAEIAKSSFYLLAKAEPIKNKLAVYGRKSRGRGPAKAGDV